MSMLTKVGALELIAQNLRSQKITAHSIFVGNLMALLAEQQNMDSQSDLWTMIGFCHDLDLEQIDGDWSRHGVMAAEMLAGRLPQDALDAIAAHDYRSSVTAHGLLADMIKVADAAALLDILAGRDVMSLLEGQSARFVVDQYLPGKTHLSTPLDEIPGNYGLSLSDLVGLVRRLPEQVLIID